MITKCDFLLPRQPQLPISLPLPPLLQPIGRVNPFILPPSVVHPSSSLTSTVTRLHCTGIRLLHFTSYHCTSLFISSPRIICLAPAFASPSRLVCYSPCRSALCVAQTGQTPSSSQHRRCSARGCSATLLIHVHRDEKPQNAFRTPQETCTHARLSLVNCCFCPPRLF